MRSVDSIVTLYIHDMTCAEFFGCVRNPSLRLPPTLPCEDRADEAPDIPSARLLRKQNHAMIAVTDTRGAAALNSVGHSISIFTSSPHTKSRWTV